MMEYFTLTQRGIRCTMCTLERMLLVTLAWDNGMCILKTKFFLLLLPVLFLTGPPPEETPGPKPGKTPDLLQPPTEEGRRIPDTPGEGDRGRPRPRYPDLVRDRDRGLGRGRGPRDRTPASYNRGGNSLPREIGEEEEEEEEVGENLETGLRRLLDKWEQDLERLRDGLRHALLTL
ncbi:E4 protein [Bovine papillomavirus BAA5-Japan]|nr:E4 protein [Bovine papillomavirus BAA5-Japan]AYP67473.1 E4 protein [Bos taurus papillomavirus 10]AYP67480.1 E4 protein [Bos taurus papillomavirus 10]AYP67487.1 E4 protein [Bos taurus papillomavirus 10]